MTLVLLVGYFFPDLFREMLKHWTKRIISLRFEASDNHDWSADHMYEAKCFVCNFLVELFILTPK